MYAATKTKEEITIHYHDHPALDWMRRSAPCGWYRNTHLDFCQVPFGLLELSGSLRDTQIVGYWLQKLKAGKAVPPPIVCLTERGTYYLHDGNHRYEALQMFLGGDSADFQVRVGLMLPETGFCFRRHWFATYATYLLEPNRREPTRTQRMQPPILGEEPRCSAG